MIFLNKTKFKVEKYIYNAFRIQKIVYNKKFLISKNSFEKLF